MLKYRYVAIEGIIGAGKTTLAKLLGEEINSRLLLEEFADNPFLEKFYKEPQRYAFSVEMSFLADRYHKIKKFFDSPDLFQPTVISDYAPFKSLIFAQTNLGEEEFKLYREFFEMSIGKLPKPDLVVFLDRTIPVLLKHIKQRGRGFEQSIQEEYLVSLKENYIRFFKQTTEQKVLVLNADQYNFLNNKADVRLILGLLEEDFKPGLNFTF